MKSKILIMGGGCRVSISDIRRQLETAGIDMTDIEISETLSVNEADLVVATDQRMKLEAMHMAIRAMPDPVDIREFPPRQVQPRFQFKNIRKIRK